MNSLWLAVLCLTFGGLPPKANFNSLLELSRLGYSLSLGTWDTAYFLGGELVVIPKGFALYLHTRMALSSSWFKFSSAFEVDGSCGKSFLACSFVRFLKFKHKLILTPGVVEGS